MGKKFTEMKPIDSKEVARLTQELDALQQQRSEYMAGLTPINDSIRKTEFALAAALAAFEINEHVIWRDGSVEKRAIIGQINYSYGRPEYYVYVLKKDGTPGVRLHRIWGALRHNDVLRPDPAATPADNNLQAATVARGTVVQDVGGTSVCS